MRTLKEAKDRMKATKKIMSRKCKRCGMSWVYSISREDSEYVLKIACNCQSWVSR